MDQHIPLLIGTAATLGFVHTFLGPDHYLPFVNEERCFFRASMSAWRPSRNDVSSASICFERALSGTVAPSTLGR